MMSIEDIIREAIEGYKKEHNKNPSYLILNGATYEGMRVGTNKWKTEEINELLTYLGVPICLVLSKKNNTYVRVI